MPVQEWIAGTRGAMSERRCDESGRGEPLRTGRRAFLRRQTFEVLRVVRTSLHAHGFTFQPPDRRTHCVLAGFDHCALDSWIVRDRVQDAGRLRCLERQIESRHPTRVGSDLVAVRRQPARTGAETGEHGTKILGVDLALETESRCTAADPLAVGLAGAGVVVVERLGDTRQLVRLLPDAQLRDRQHAPQREPRSPTG
jgi:hypothetical protein